MEQEQKTKRGVGKPAKDSENPINKHVGFKTTQQQVDKISDIAKAEGVTKGQIIRTALTEYLKKADADSKEQQ